MNTFFDYILSLIRLDRTIRYHDNQSSLMEMMNQLCEGQKLNLGIICSKISDSKYILEPEENTPVKMSGPFFNVQQDCTINVKIVSKSDQLQFIQCTGRIRPVHFGLPAIFFTIVSLQYSPNGDGLSITALITLTIIWILSHLLANFYWSQKEKDVIHQFKKSLLILMKIYRS